MSSRSVLTAALAGLALTMAGPASPGTSTAARPAPVEQCGDADLTASYRADGGAAGSRFGWILLRNTSGEPCAVQGYGGLSHVGASGRQVGAAARREGGPARRIVLEPGQRVRSRVREAAAQNYPRSECRPREVEGFRVYVPGATVSQFVTHPAIGCADRSVRLISQRPYRRP